MNTQMERPRGHSTAHDEDRRSHDHDIGGHDEGEHHGGGNKKSVLKKVKAKAKKIKDSLTGHGHDHDHNEDDDDNDEMDTDPNVHGAPGSHGILIKEGITTQHETDTRARAHERTAISGHAPGSNPGAYQVFETTTTQFVPGQEETVEWSRTDTGLLPQSGKPRHELGHTHALGIGHSTGTHSTGDLGIGRKPKLGGILEKETHPQTKAGEELRHGSYQAKVGHPTGAAHDVTLGKESIARHHGTDIGSGYQVFDPKTTHYVPGEEETLDWSRTDTGTLPGHTNQPRARHHPPDVHSSGIHSTGDSGIGHKDTGNQLLGNPNQPREYRHTPDDVHLSGIHSTGDSGVGHKPKIGGIIEKDSHVLGQDIHPSNYQAHVPVSKPVGYQTFDTTGSRYIPGQDETMGWSITDTGRSKLKEEQPLASKNTPITARAGHHRMEEMGEPGKLREMIDRRMPLERDPHAPRGVREKPFAENYQSKVTDPTGLGGEEIGVTPILHQLGKTNIHKTDPNTGMEQQEHLFRPSLDEDQNMSTGSHDQFSPEPVARSQFGQESLCEVQHKPESYTGMISSAATELAYKAKQATGTVTSKLGYGGTDEIPTSQQPRQVPLEHGEESEGGSVAGSIGEYGKKVVSTVQEKIAPVYDKVAGLGSGVSSHDDESTIPSDKGVSVTEYLAEKLKPAEEDKAMSKAITEALPLHKSKDVGEGAEEEVTEVTKVVIKGRVTESDEVANQFGRAEDISYDGAGPGLAMPGKTVMDRIYDAAGSWFNKSGEPGVEADDHTDKGDQRSRENAAREARPKQNVGETRLL